MLRRAIRKVIRETRKWLKEEPMEKQKCDEDPFAYSWLNSIYTKILPEGGGFLTQPYTWGVLQGVHLAKAIGIKHVSVVEFGVAGGRGLISLEKIAERVAGVFGVGIDVYGFDSGVGLPKPQDYRDLPNLYSAGDYPMDPEKLQRCLRNARLILGLVKDTVPKFIESNPAPVAFTSFDLDLYSSTMQAFKLLDARQDLLLPRIHCYFDDIMGATCSDYTGERLAISEFNASHDMRKISSIYGLKYFLPRQHANNMWSEMFYMAHIFDHDLYGADDGLIRLRTRDLSPEETSAGQVKPVELQS